MDIRVLRKVAAELDESLRGAFVNKVHQPLPRELLLAVRVPSGGGARLSLSADPLLGRIHITALRIANPPRPPRFCAFLRAHFQGARIQAVTARADDRIVTVSASRGSGPQRVDLDLVLELLGRDSNILLVDRTTGLILDCLHHIPEKETTTRVVLPGMTYLGPPKPPGRRQDLLCDPNTASIAPGIRTDSTGTRRLVPDAGPGDEAFPTMNQAAEAFFSPRMQSLVLDAARREAAAPLKTRVRSLDRRMGKIREDYLRLKQYESLAQEGELIKANLKSITKGMSQLTVIDWNSGQPRTIKLDPSLGPVANMERIFKKVAKARRGQGIVQQRLDETMAEKSALEEMLYFMDQSEDLEEMESISTRTTRAHGTDTRERPVKHPDRREQGARMVLEFRCPSGLPVLVGKSSTGNDFLLRHASRKGDLWFHVQGLPGAHVLIPQRGKERATDEDIHFAAGLALHYSKARGSGKGEAIVAHAEDLERPKGALPGQVKVRKHRSIACREHEPHDQPKE